MKHLAVILVLLGSFVINAQDKVKFDAQIRPRYEINNKDFNSNIDAKSYTYLRSRLGALFTPSENISGYIQFQDSRSFGDGANTTTNNKNIDLHQGFLKISKIFDSSFSLQVGRMQIGFGNQRFIGISDWGNTGRSLDGILVNHTSENVVLDLFAYKLNERSNAGDTNDLNLYGAFATITSIENLAIKPFLFWEKGIPTNNLNRWTIGVDIVGNIGNLTYEPEFAYQFGKMNYVYPANPKDRFNMQFDIPAFFGALNLTYKFEGNLQPKLNIGVEYFSGDDFKTSTKLEGFSNLYGSNHAYFGISDIIGQMPQTTFDSGLLDIHARFSFVPIKDLTFTAALFSFSANQEIVMESERMTKDFGMEADFYLDYKYDKNISLNAGFALFSPGDAFKLIYGRDSATWFYTGLVLNL
ncbi:MAG: alginate export family protein [Melioribacteraceae bacterium]|nr:alginate export family protein [Melioribacteraceae bacterium]